MKAAIFLSGYGDDQHGSQPAPDLFDLVIAVGKAARHVSCAIWVCNEADTFDAVEPLRDSARPMALLTSQDCLVQIQNGPHADRLERHEVRMIEQLWQETPAAEEDAWKAVMRFPRALGFTISRTTIAIAAAAAAGATDIVLIGKPDRDGMDKASGMSCKAALVDLLIHLKPRGINLSTFEPPAPPMVVEEAPPRESELAESPVVIHE